MIRRPTHSGHSLQKWHRVVAEVAQLVVTQVQVLEAFQKVWVSHARWYDLQLVVAKVKGHKVVKAGEELKVKVAQSRVAQV